MYTLLEEYFDLFPIGNFPYDPDHSAMGEYHYMPPTDYIHGWTDQVCNYTWNGTGPSWIITEVDDRYFMECTRIEKGRPHTMWPTLQRGSPFWHDLHVSCTLRRLSTNGMAGLAFCLTNSLNTLVFQLNKAGAALVHRDKEEEKVLKTAPFPHNCDEYYRLAVECDKDTVACYINGQHIFTVQSPLVERGGKIGITADCPTQFTDVLVEVEVKTVDAIELREYNHIIATEEAQSQNPPMKLWKKIDLYNFGAGRQIRFGHLEGGNKWHIVLAQAQKRVSRDAYPHISCLTAIDFDGMPLWQKGVPSESAKDLGKISADLPFQVYDIDGDGKDEVICAINFELFILKGATGEVKRSIKTPLTDETKPIIGAPPGGYAFDRLNVDAISIVNLSGSPRPQEILIKDRYCRLYALDAELNLLWHYHSDVNIGHFPLAVDINNDGKDEILCGYHLLSSTGEKLWEYPLANDHVDEIVYGKFMAGSDEGHFACVAGSDGFYIGDTRGNILKRHKIGHAQRISIANYDPSRPGYEIAVSNFWGHQGIIYLYDSQGNPILEMENELNGNLLTPVNWKGDGQEYFLTNAHPTHGGLYDASGMQVVAFPDDGHPTMCCEAINLTGDLRDELVVWDYHDMYIYTQDDVQDKNAYAPRKCPHYNGSNYRGEYAW